MITVLLVLILVVAIVILILLGVSFFMLVGICRMIDKQFDKSLSNHLNDRTYEEYRRENK